MSWGNISFSEFSLKHRLFWGDVWDVSLATPLLWEQFYHSCCFTEGDLDISILFWKSNWTKMHKISWGFGVGFCWIQSVGYPWPVILALAVKPIFTFGDRFWILALRTEWKEVTVKTYRNKYLHRQHCQGGSVIMAVAGFAYPLVVVPWDLHSQQLRIYIFVMTVLWDLHGILKSQQHRILAAPHSSETPHVSHWI